MCVLCRALGNELDSLWHSGASAIGDGAADTATPTRAFANTVGQGGTGDQEADGLLSGVRWSGTVTYSFTDSASDYASGYGYGEPLNGFGKITSTQQSVVHKVMTQIESFTNLNIDYAGTNGADIRIAKSSEANPTAYAYYPSNSARGEGGDIWFGTSYNYGSPSLGSYSYHTHIHEIGHAFGLKHSHETGGVAGALPSAHDALEYTVMAYRSYPGAPTSGGYPNEAFGYPQSFMMNDILALQTMYGADYTVNSGDSVYTWSASTGQMSINGTGQGAPGANRVFLTIWDGGGTDTYDLSNYSTRIEVDLRPGQYSTTSMTQKAYLGDGHYAKGNVYNAYLFDNDRRSYIENAIGGSGNDWLAGNDGNNQLDGGSGNDTLKGQAGDDTFIYRSGGGHDIIRDFTAGAGGVDEISLLGFNAITSFAQAISYASQVNQDTVFGFGSGSSLTLLNVLRASLVAGDFIFANSAPANNQAPTNLTLSNTQVNENEVAATIGNLSVTDPDGESAFTFTLSDSRFQVAGNAGAYVLKLKSGQALDYEAEQAVTVDITVEDVGGLTYTEQFTIAVQDASGFTITGTNGNDKVNAGYTIAGQQHPTGDADTIYGMGGNDILRGYGGNDTIFGGAGNDYLMADEGDDVLNGDAGVDTLEGRAGNDTFQIAGAEAAYDTMVGGDGTDAIEVLGADPVTLAGFSSGNSIESWIGNNSGVIGSTSGDVLDFSGLTSVSGLLYITGAAGNDVITGTFAADNLIGGGGNDTLRGGAGEDLLEGKAGADILEGGAGDDILVGGTEMDSFVFSLNFGHDTIQDFAAGHDLLQFDSAVFANYTDVMSHAATAGADVVITYDVDNTLTLQSITLASLVADDFRFV